MRDQRSNGACRFHVMHYAKYSVCCTVLDYIDRSSGGGGALRSSMHSMRNDRRTRVH